MGIILRATIIYWVLLAVLRLLGRRAVSQLSPFEFIVVFLLGGMSIQAIVSDDRAVTGAVLGILTIAVNHLIVSSVKQRSPLFQKLVDGTPVIVARNGQVDRNRLQGMRMMEEDILAAARQQGIETLDGVRLAVVERDGTLTVMKAEK